MLVNEQIDLFLNLQKKGSAQAGFLAFLALVAEGYAKKKPENLFEALKIIKNINISELDKMPLIGCLDLLLANIESAENRFLLSSDENLRELLKSSEGDKLDVICIFCKNWLENEVLKGYRDIQIDEVDLNSWFEDSEIQGFIEKYEKKSNYSFSSAYIKKISNNFKKNTDESTYGLKTDEDIQDQSNLPLPGGNKEDFENFFSDYGRKKDLIQLNLKEILEKIYELYSEFKFIISDLLKSNQFRNKQRNIIYVNVFLLLFVFGIASSFIRNNSKNLEEENIPVKTLNKKNNSLNSENFKFLKSNEVVNIEENQTANNNVITIKTINSYSPTLTEIEYILMNWLKNKSIFLAGKGDIDLSNIVQANLLKRLEDERSNDLKKNITKIINTEIQSIEYLTKSSSRISVLANLKYSEEILNNNGEVVNTITFTPFLKVKYILGYSAQSWKLVDYVSGV